MDFVSIVFDDEIEIQLFKLQAFSFQVVEANLVHRILVVFNGSNEQNDAFAEKFQHWIPYYPPYLRDKVKLVFMKDIDLYFTKSDWYSQQVVKIQISKMIETEYYVVLDTKNHFIKHINRDLFFANNGKPHLYLNDAGEVFGNYYNNCLTYFKTSCPNAGLGLGRLRIQTITPFLFITKECKNLMHYVEKKEKKSFHHFFTESKMYTEFYFYYCYLVHTSKDKLYEINFNYIPFVTIGNQDPKIHTYNSWKSINHVLNSQNIYVFSLHRYSLCILDEEYKKNLINFYIKTYKYQDILQRILYFLY